MSLIGFFAIAKTIAGPDGTAEFSYQTTNPSDLGFDLNVASSPLDPGDVTVVTSVVVEAVARAQRRHHAVRAVRLILAPELESGA